MAAGQNMTTLRAVLTQRKPPIACRTRACKNSTGPWPSFPDHAITIWHDFNLETLNESYGHILDLDVPKRDLAMSEPLQMLGGVNISDPEDVRHLFMWNVEVMRPALAVGMTHLDLHDGVRLYQEVSAPGGSQARIRGTPSSIKVDHVIALDEFPHSNLVIGLGRPSSKFQGRRLAAHPERASKESLWPLRQLANLCREADTRYGYVLTDEDLVACCFSSSEPRNWKAALMPVPWSRYGPSQLTTDLALWWLSMLAMSDPGHCKIVGDDAVIRVNQWEHRYHEEKHCWVRRHRYSNFEEPTESSSAAGFPLTSSSGAAASASAYAGGTGGTAALFPNLDIVPEQSSDDLDMLIDPTLADDPWAAGIDHFDLNGPNVSRG